MSFVGGSLNLKGAKAGVNKKKGKKKGTDITADALSTALAEDREVKSLPASSKCASCAYIRTAVS
jgi:hypothetical protein